MKISFFIFAFIISAFNLLAQENDLRIICPSQTRENDILPIVIKSTGVNSGIFNCQIDFNNAYGNDSVVRVYHGMGSISPKVAANGDFELSVIGFNASRSVVIQNNIFQEISGIIDDDFTCPSGSLIHITGDLAISSGRCFKIEAGAQLLISENVNIFIYGKLMCDGQIDNPIVFKSFDPSKYWGGLIVQSPDSSVINYTFFVNGGNNSNFHFGHSDSQPVIKINSSYLLLNNCYIINNPGKGLASEHAHVILKNSIISHCDTGGEFLFGKTAIDSCYVLAIPNDDGLYQDDDNDGFYFYETMNGNQPSSIKNSFIISTEDDGIDQNGAILNIENCRIQNCYHEGIACSNYNSVNVFNTLVQDCMQGIESGYGNPKLTVNHCLFLNNTVGVRYGDEYETPSDGKVIIKNSILFNNTDNILNFDPQNGQPNPDSLIVSFSITNDEDFDNFNSNIAAEPIFTPDYFLELNSPGKKAASDGTDMGLYNDLSFAGSYNINRDFNIYPDISLNRLLISIQSDNAGSCNIFLFDIPGNKIKNFNRQFNCGKTEFYVDISNIKSGLYLCTLLWQGGSISRKIVITR